MVKYHIIILVTKGRDLNDIIRDNSMQTIMLNAYATYEGVAFLGHCLQSTLVEVLPTIEDCEIDPSKLPENDTKTLEENMGRLIDATMKFVNSIVGGKNKCRNRSKACAGSSTL